MAPCGEPFVIGMGRDYVGALEIVAMRSGVGPCISLDRRRTSAGVCGGGLTPPEGRALVANQWSYHSSRRKRSSEIAGRLRGDIAAVRVRYRRNGEPHEVMATVARVHGELLERLGEETPFGVFAIAVPGCFNAKRFRAAAIDDSGTVVGRDRGPGFGGPRCDAGPGLTTGFVETIGRRPTVPLRPGIRLG